MPPPYGMDDTALPNGPRPIGTKSQNGEDCCLVDGVDQGLMAPSTSRHSIPGHCANYTENGFSLFRRAKVTQRKVTDWRDNRFTFLMLLMKERCLVQRPPFGAILGACPSGFNIWAEFFSGLCAQSLLRPSACNYGNWRAWNTDFMANDTASARKVATVFVACGCGACIWVRSMKIWLGDQYRHPVR